MGNSPRPLIRFGLKSRLSISVQAQALCLLSFCLSLIPLILPTARNFEYEYALLTSLLAVISLPIAGLFARIKMTTCNFGGADVVAILSCPILMMLPGWIFFRLGLCECSEPGFLFWMALQLVPSALIGLGGFMLVCSRRRDGVSATGVIGIIVLVMVLSVMILWFFPQKRIISPALGFLHGPIYDRWIPVDGGVVFGRISDALLGLVLILTAWTRFKMPSLKFAAVIFCILILKIYVFFWPSGGHGFTALNRELSSEISGVDVILRYKHTNSWDETIARALLHDAEFYVNEIKRDLNAEIKSPIKIYAYKNQEQKKVLFGGGDTDIADVWTPSVHIELSESPHPTLRHELVHAVASFVSWFDIGFHPNMMFTEGLAMALAPIDQEIDVDIIAASLLKTGRLNRPENLLNPLGFWSESSGPAYFAAGSFLRWMGREYGRDAIRKIYSGGSVKSAVGVEQIEMFRAWQQRVLSLYDVKKDMVVEKFARDLGVLNDFCPHSIADMSRSRSDGLMVRLRQPVGWDPERLLDWRIQRMPGRRPLESAKLSRDIKLKLKANYLDASALDLFVQSTVKGRRSPPETVEDIGLLLLQSDLEILRGRADRSRSVLIETGKIFMEKDPGPLLRRQYQVRMGLLDSGISLAVHGEWQKYLMGVNVLPPGGDDSHWVMKYLKARRENHPQLAQLADWNASILTLRDFPDVQREWMRVVAEGYAKNQEFDQAQRVYEELSELLTGDAKLLAQENGRRMKYLRGRIRF